MSLDPAFRLYRTDPQARILPTLADQYRYAAQEREAMTAAAHSLILKGRLTRTAAQERERIWGNIVALLIYPSTMSYAASCALGAATWRETVAELRRLIVMRRDALDRRAEAGEDTAELEVALDRVETLHDAWWTHTAYPEAIDARRLPAAPAASTLDFTRCQPLDTRAAAS